MTNREKFIEVFGNNPQRHHITKSWWDEEYVPPITNKFDLDDFTYEGRTNIENISIPTGITFYDELQESEDNDSENKEIKEILIMFINRIKYDGYLYPFSFEEKDRMINIANKWLNEEEV